MKHLTVCRILKADGTPCGQQFTADPLKVVNGIPDKSATNLIQGLLKHVEKKHPEAFAQLQQRWVLMMGFLTLRCFQSEDPGVTAEIKSYQDFLISLTAPPPQPPPQA